MTEEKKQPQLLRQVGDYWNTRAEGYSMDVQEELAGEAGHAWLELITEEAPQERFPRVLDIGCGPGFFITLLGQQGYTVSGIDYTENMLAEAAKNTAAYGVTAELRRMDAQNLDFADAQFDLIVTRNVTWNLEYPEQAYKEWMRVLRPGGILINADGNHYLHYADPAYQKLQGHSEHKHMEHIDVHIIDEIARVLPLSHVHRPAWDEATLRALGADAFHLARVVSETIDGGDGEPAELIRTFVLVARKGVEA